jgi:hypothetical protein
VRETFCHRCQRVVKTTVAGACLACGIMVAAPATGVTPVAGPLTGHSAIYPSPSVSAEGPHVAEQDFTTHIPGAEIAAGGGTVIQGAAHLRGEGSLEGGGPVASMAHLSGSGSLTAG